MHVLILALCSCAADVPRDEGDVVVREPVPLSKGKAQQAKLCGRGRSDLVTDLFCTKPPQPIGSLVELRAALGFESNENGLYQGFAVTGHSTSLGARSVSAINPRIIFIKYVSETFDLVALAFTRGPQFVEFVDRDRRTGTFQFYLADFTQACNELPGGCSPGDVLSETAETGWRNFNVYAEEDLENTPRDCRVCHQPDGPKTPKLLRMQEFEPPWNHWFFHLAASGRAVLEDYYAAKGDEVFAGLPADAIETSEPGLLSSALFFVGSGTQPNPFVSAQIEKEVMASAAALGGNQPNDNTVPGRSEVWNAIYERAKRGEAISVPYHDVKVTDASKLAGATQAYVDYRQGRLDRKDLPDLRDVHPDDPMLRAEIGLDTEPGLDANEVLAQACSQCHNDRLNQTLSRARFNPKLSKLARAEKNQAIARLMLPPDDPAVMPPVFARQLTDEARARLIELLGR